MQKAITLIGILDNGCVNLSSQAFHQISQAQILIGGKRHLKFFPDFSGKTITIASNPIKQLNSIITLSQENTIVILASGDPMFYGIGSLLIQKAGIKNVHIIPNLSSLQLAFARIGIKWDDAKCISLHGRTIKGVVNKIRNLNKVVFFTDKTNNPKAIARYFLSYNQDIWKVWICENLEGPNENITLFESLTDLANYNNSDFSDLNIIVLIRNTSVNYPILTNLHEDKYAKRMPKKGLITKKEVRLLSIEALKIKQNSIIWDVGAASGSIAIETALLAIDGTSYAIEVDSESIEFCKQNIYNLGVDNVEIIEGLAPQILHNIQEDPDCIFIGGSKGKLEEIIKYCFSRLQNQGNMVINAITFENIQITYETLKALHVSFEVTQLQVSRGVPIAKFHRYEAQNPIHIFHLYKD